jgi:ferredoxin-NADP reductase
MLEAVGPHPSARPQVFVCGSTPFVETVADVLLRLGHAADRIKTERYGGRVAGRDAYGMEMLSPRS